MTLTAEDPPIYKTFFPAGTDRIEYALDSGPFQNYTGPIAGIQPGDASGARHTLAFRSWSKAGLVSDTKTLSWIVDTDSPEASIPFVVVPFPGFGRAPAHNATVLGNVTFEAKARDATSRLLKAQFSVNGQVLATLPLGGAQEELNWTVDTRAWPFGNNKVTLTTADVLGHTGSETVNVYAVSTTVSVSKNLSRNVERLAHPATGEPLAKAGALADQALKAVGNASGTADQTLQSVRNASGVLVEQASQAARDAVGAANQALQTARDASGALVDQALKTVGNASGAAGQVVQAARNASEGLADQAVQAVRNATAGKADAAFHTFAQAQSNAQNTGTGYLVFDSSSLAGPSFAFEDISATGTPVQLGDEQVSDAIAAPGVRFYGVAYHRMFLSSNGWLSFTSGQAPSPQAQSIPNASPPNNLIAAYWADLDPNRGGSVHAKTVGSAPLRTTIVQFKDVPHKSDPTKLASFQVRMQETTGIIEVHYLRAASDGSVHAAGLENSEGSRAAVYRLGDFSLENTAVRFVPHSALVVR